MSGFFGGSSAKTDRGNQLAGVNASWNVFNTGMPLAAQQTSSGQANQSTGVQGLTSANDFWKSILSGNRTATQTAAAPMINSANTQADAARAQQGQTGTARGGGVAGENQQLQTGRMAAANNAIFQAAPAAAQQEAETSNAIAGVGSQQLSQALQALGLSESAANEIINSSIQSRPISIDANPLNAVPSAVVNGALKSLGL